MSDSAAASQNQLRESEGNASEVSPRTGKAIARRIDLSYHKRPHPLRTLRRALVIIAALATLAWLVLAIVFRGQRIYNPGPLAPGVVAFPLPVVASVPRVPGRQLAIAASAQLIGLK